MIIYKKCESTCFPTVVIGRRSRHQPEDAGFASSSSDVMAARSTERTVRDDTVVVGSVEFDHIDRRPPHIPSAETLFTSMGGALLIPAIWLLGELVWV